MKNIVFATSAILAMTSFADMQSQQAMALAQQLAGQVDLIQNNVDDHAARLSKLERGGGSDVAALQARIAALEASNAELRRKMEVMRSEITADLSKKIEQLLRPSRIPPKPQPTVGPHKEYVVQSGDTLSLVAEAFGTKVSVIKEMNNLKNDNLRIGQKLKVPIK